MIITYISDDRAIINQPCKHYNDRGDLYPHYKARLEEALHAARNSHPIKKFWAPSQMKVNVDAATPPRVINEIEATVLVAYGRATLQGFKMNDTDPLGDQLVEPLFYFLSKAYEKLQKKGRNTTDTLYFVKTDKSGYISCWPRWPTSLTQPEIAYKDKMKAMLLSGKGGTIYQIKPLGAVDFSLYLNGKEDKLNPRFLIMPCSQYMVTDRAIKNHRRFVYLEEMDPNCARCASVSLLFIPTIFISVLLHRF